MLKRNAPSSKGKEYPVKKRKWQDLEDEDTGNGDAQYIVKNALFFWYYSDSTAIPHPTIRFNYRVKFLDT